MTLYTLTTASSSATALIPAEAGQRWQFTSLIATVSAYFTTSGSCDLIILDGPTLIAKVNLIDSSGSVPASVLPAIVLNIDASALPVVSADDGQALNVTVDNVTVGNVSLQCIGQLV